ncbi:hypothetical protein EPN52_04675 [bacterium]|nr:MAG: hypothetical protein EPN52_04675 [bacterium]
MMLMAAPSPPAPPAASMRTVFFMAQKTRGIGAARAILPPCMQQATGSQGPGGISPASTFLLVGIVIIAIVTGIVAYGVIRDSRAALIDAYLVRLDLQRAQTLITEEVTAVRGYVSIRQRPLLANFDATDRELQYTLDSLRARARRPLLSGLSADVADVEAMHARWHRSVAAPLLAGSAAAARLEPSGNLLVDHMNADLTAAQGVAEAAAASTESSVARTVAVSIGVIVFFVVMLGIVALRLEYVRFAKERALRSEIDERNQALERSNASLQEFAYVASHDLQEPLRTVASFTQLLQRRYAGRLDKDADEFIAFAVDGATRMQQLVNDILEYSRITTHGKPLVALDLKVPLERALTNLRSAIAEHGAAIDVQTLPVVWGDEVQLTQLLQNLVANSMKYCNHAQPEVAVRATRSDGEWTISVHDNGIGIAPEYHERIFRIFQRLHSRGEYEGTGIGLAICKRIVDRHGGRIWVESEEGQGATFSFTLRAATASEGEAG